MLFMLTMLAELEARVAALEAERADYKAVLATINALNQQTRHRLDTLDEKIDGVERRLTTKIDDTNARVRLIDDRVRSIEDTVAEVKDLLVRALDNR
jgi:BMFP domain-containing protein YqiC